MRYINFGFYILSHLRCIAPCHVTSLNFFFNIWALFYIYKYNNYNIQINKYAQLVQLVEHQIIFFFFILEMQVRFLHWAFFLFSLNNFGLLIYEKRNPTHLFQSGIQSRTRRVYAFHNREFNHEHVAYMRFNLYICRVSTVFHRQLKKMMWHVINDLQRTEKQ